MKGKRKMRSRQEPSVGCIAAEVWVNGMGLRALHLAMWVGQAIDGER